MKGSMKESPIPSPSLCPYDTLHIYYMAGRIAPADLRFGDTFLGNWEEDAFSFLFFNTPSDEEVRRLLDNHPGVTLIDQYQMTYEEWQGGPIEPFIISDFLILPPWNANASNTSLKKKLLLDPGVVFGNGAHPTTQECLDLISRLLKFIPISTMIDLGAGTGLLSLGAASHGVQKIMAVDFNYLAARTALKNIRLNGFEKQIIAVHGMAETFIDTPADLMVANIHYDVMQRLIESKGFLEKKWFILSGLLRSQAEILETRLSRMPVTLLDKRESGGVWHTFFGKVDDQ